MPAIPFEMPLTIRRGREDDENGWSIKLGGVELAGVLAADGIGIQFESAFEGIYPQPVVTLKFGHGALDLDLDIKVLRELLERKEKEAEASV